jgi:hypothetical protein
MIIYQIKNMINGKVYVGQSQKSFEERYRNILDSESVKV